MKGGKLKQIGRTKGFLKLFKHRFINQFNIYRTSSIYSQIIDNQLY